MPKCNVVLAYIEKDDKYLMLLRNKRENDMNKNKYLGIGGHVEDGETPDEALIREIKEETNLDVIHYTYRGIVYFRNNIEDEDMYLYHVDKFEGNQIKDCDEGSLLWVPKKDILKLNLWEGDYLFLEPFMNTCELIELEVVYDGDKLVSFKKYDNK